MGDAAQRAEEITQRCRQAAYIDMLLGKVYGIPEDKHNVMVRKGLSPTDRHRLL